MSACVCAGETGGRPRSSEEEEEAKRCPQSGGSRRGQSVSASHLSALFMQFPRRSHHLSPLAAPPRRSHSFDAFSEVISPVPARTCANTHAHARQSVVSLA